MSDMVWEDPPPSKSGRGSRHLQKLAVELREHPGKWALVNEKASSPSSHADLRVRYGCEITTRRNDNSTWRIYARWPEGKQP